MPLDIEKLPKEAQQALKLFKEFQLEKFNDSGANGYVMIGRHTVLNRNIAIKIYFHEENDIDQEPAIIAKLSHDNILKVYDARKVEECCSYYMMQAANDGDLFDYQKRFHLSLKLSHELLCQLLSGLAVLHTSENMLVHRDLKPENLLIHSDQLVIADFGSVRKLEEATAKAPASRLSILYKPPEASGENGYYNFPSDIYQAGIVGYLLFGGKLNKDLCSYLTARELKELKKIEASGKDYEGIKHVDACIEKRTAAGKLLDWNTIPFYVPRKIIRALKTATATNADKRYKSVSEFLAELAKAKESLPNWLANNEGCELQDWKGNDYSLTKEKGQVLIKKKKHSKKTYRLDKSIQATDFKTAHHQLGIKIGLP